MNSFNADAQTHVDRRSFLAMTAVATAAATTNSIAAERNVKFTRSLAWGAVGVQANQKQAVDYAVQYKFGSVSASVGDLQTMSAAEREALLEEMKNKSVVWGSAGLPVQFRTSEEDFQKGIRALPEQAKLLREVGVSRVGTYLLPSHDTLTYLENFHQHRDRLRECARILNDEGLRFALEYVGPKTSWTAKNFAFIHTQKELFELVDAIGLKNVGLLLDSWHWYTSKGTVDDLKFLNNGNVVDVQVNDAPAGLEVDEQMDLSRELPTATGVIDLKSFMQELVRMDYDGPISCEPFNKKLNDMENDDALKASIDSLDNLFALVGA